MLYFKELCIIYSYKFHISINKIFLIPIPFIPITTIEFYEIIKTYYIVFYSVFLMTTLLLII